MTDSAPDPSGHVDVAISEEHFAVVAPGVTLCYQTFGEPGSDPLLLVMGLGGPMIWWHDDLCRRLAGAGFYVIRYDNRDTGRSSRAPGHVTRAALVRAFAGGGGRPAYTLSDLAEDAVGLLDALDLDSAHVVGVSMGGMIAQTLAVEHPHRVRTLTSISSTTGRRSVGWQHPRLMPVLLAARGPGREVYVETAARTWQLIGSPAYPPDPEEVRQRAGETYDRGISTSGVLRQMLAVLHQPHRGPRLRGLRLPALVIHGTADPMVHVSGGRATAAAIPGAELLVVDGMGHDLPRELWETFVEAIRRTADRANG